MNMHLYVYSVCSRLRVHFIYMFYLTPSSVSPPPGGINPPELQLPHKAHNMKLEEVIEQMLPYHYCITCVAAFPAKCLVTAALNYTC